MQIGTHMSYMINMYWDVNLVGQRIAFFLYLDKEPVVWCTV